jgi:hypothetical protein
MAGNDNDVGISFWKWERKCYGAAVVWIAVLGIVAMTSAAVSQCIVWMLR